MDNKYKNIIYIDSLGKRGSLPALKYENFSEPQLILNDLSPPPFATYISEIEIQEKYKKKQYTDIVNDACHELTSVVAVKNYFGKIYYICTTCSERTVGDTIEEAIELMAERIIIKIDRGETGQC